MPEEETILRLKLNVKGVFDIRDFYTYFYDVITTLGYDVYEKNYARLEKKGTTDLKILWDCIKIVDDYTRFYIKMGCYAQDLESVEVEKEDLKVLAERGEVNLNLVAVIRTDWQARWETSPILKFLKKIFENYVYKATYNRWKEQISRELHQAHNEAKAFFHLQKINA